MKAWQNVLIGFLGGLLFGGVILLFFLPQRGEPIRLVTATPNDAALTSPTSSTVQIHVAGAVQNPGVYILSENARNVDAITAAGGTTDEADLERINLSEFIKDGQRVYVPYTGQPISTSEGSSTISLSPAESALVNINTADAAALMSLPGIGEVKAAAIITYRETYGPFTSIEALLNVNGIGQATLEGLRELITLGP
jgi:competence protein ComEA